VTLYRLDLTLILLLEEDQDDRVVVLVAVVEDGTIWVGDKRVVAVGDRGEVEAMVLVEKVDEVAAVDGGVALEGACPRRVGKNGDRLVSWMAEQCWDSTVFTNFNFCARCSTRY
jgi:hypothetical protein